MVASSWKKSWKKRLKVGDQHKKVAVVKHIEWTSERLRILGDTELQNVKQNAAKANRQDLVALCEIEISLRDIKTFRAKSGNRRHKSGPKALADEIAEEMGAFAKNLSKRLDLSEGTARIQSSNTKGFIAHKLVDSRGRAKTGGAEKTKALQFDRLLSYRVGDATITVSAFLPVGEDTVRHQVNGPEQFLPDGMTFAESGRAGLYKPRAGTEIYRFKSYLTLKEALEAYGRLVQELQQTKKIAPL